MSSKYNKAIKITFFTENQLPDLNVADYPIGFGHINYLDRYFTFPYIVNIIIKKSNVERFQNSP